MKSLKERFINVTMPVKRFDPNDEHKAPKGGHYYCSRCAEAGYLCCQHTEYHAEYTKYIPDKEEK